MEHDALTDFPRITLDRLKLAADVILSEGEDIGDALTAELPIDRTSGRHAGGKAVCAAA